MTVSILIFLVLAVIIPFAGGFARPFPKARRGKRLALIAGLGPACLAAVLAFVRIIGEGDMASLMVFALGLAIPVLLFWVGHAFGKPFSEIWRERTEPRIADTFD